MSVLAIVISQLTLTVVSTPPKFISGRTSQHRICLLHNAVASAFSVHKRHLWPGKHFNLSKSKKSGQSLGIEPRTSDLSNQWFAINNQIKTKKPAHKILFAYCTVVLNAETVSTTCAQKCKELHGSVIAEWQSMSSDVFCVWFPLAAGFLLSSISQSHEASCS